MLEQAVRVCTVIRVDCHADAAAQEKIIAFNLQGARNRIHHPLNQAHAQLFIKTLRQDQDKFIAAQPRDGVSFAGERFQAAGDLFQQQIAGIMPERIVDEFKAVQVDEQYPHPVAV